MMKLKKSDSHHRRDKKLSSKGQELLLEAEEDALGLLTGEMIVPVDHHNSTAGQTNNHNNNKANSNKRSHWGGVFGFGRSSSSKDNHTFKDNHHNNSSSNNNGESSSSSSKSKNKRPSGYTLTVTPKSMRESSSAKASSSSRTTRSKSPTTRDRNNNNNTASASASSSASVASASVSKPLSSSTLVASASTGTTNTSNHKRRTSNTQKSPPRPKPKPEASAPTIPPPPFTTTTRTTSTKERSTTKTTTKKGSSTVAGLAAPSHDTPSIMVQEQLVNREHQALSVSFSNSSSSQQQQQHRQHQQHTIRRSPSNASLQDTPAFEVTFQPITDAFYHHEEQQTILCDMEADASRLTATTVSSTATPFTATTTSTHTEKTVTSSGITTIVSSAVSVSSPAAAAAKSPTSKSTPTPVSSKQQQQQPEHSPVARAAAQASVASVEGSTGVDDFGEHDFDPNQDESSSDDDDDDANDIDMDENDTECLGSSAGPMSQTSASTSSSSGASAFQFNLAAGNMQQTTITANNKYYEVDDDGFQILRTRSSTSKLGTPSSSPNSKHDKGKLIPGAGTLPTVCSTSSSLSRTKTTSLASPSQQSRSSQQQQQQQQQQIASVISPTQSQHPSPRINASASVLSQQTSASSSLFPSSSIGSSTANSSHGQKSSSMGTSMSKTGSKSSSNLDEAVTANQSIFSAATSPRKGSNIRSGNKSTPPASPASTKKQQAKLVLSRPFGRISLPSSVTPWTVEVSPAEWDNPERRWKYRIQVTKHKAAQSRKQNQPPTPSSSVAVTWRSLENFVWLEHALNAEFQGGLVLPLLSIAVGMTDLEQVTHEVDANLLRDWLSDVMNGIRGQGELLYHHFKSIDILRSEAMEAFLYRNTAPLQKPCNLISSMMGDAILLKQKQELQLRQQRLQLRQEKLQNLDDEDEEERNCRNAMCQPSPHSASNLISPSTQQSRQRPYEGEERESFVHSFIKAPLALLTEELCVGMGCQIVEDSPSSAGSSISSPDGSRPNKKYDRFTCSSRAIGTADTLDIQDSFIDASTIASVQSSHVPQQQQQQQQQQQAKREQLGSPVSSSMVSSSQSPPSSPSSRTWKLAQSYALIKAERDLVLSYRKNALSAMERVQVLLEEEENVGLAWKRFAIALSNLFSYEKEVENARLGDKKIHRDHMPYRKVKKSTVDEALRALAQQKVDRSVPSLRILRLMLTAYVADLSAVGPSVDAYLEGMSQMAVFEEVFSAQARQLEKQKKRRTDNKSEAINKDGSINTRSTSSSQSKSDSNESSSIQAGKGKSLFGNWQEQLRSITTRQSKTNQNNNANNFEDDLVRASSTSSTDSTEDNDETLPAPATELQQKRVVEDRVLSNERLLRESLTTLCKSTPMRTARMAYGYFRSEAAQCASLRSSAGSLRSKVELSNKDTVAQMVRRHQNEDKEDMKAELALAQRMVNLGNPRKYSPSSGGSSAAASTTSEGGTVVDETIEVDTESQDTDRAMALLRDKALQIARERVGRWNSELAMAIMKAVGVDDPNVRVEETTRELRLVRKYAIGLRENLNRCIEAVDLLRNAVLKGQYGGRQELKGATDKRKRPAKPICETRKEFFTEIAKLFSGVYVEPVNSGRSPRNDDSMQTSGTLIKAGIKLNDPMKWNLTSESASPKSKSSVEGDCGGVAQTYIELRDSQTERLLTSLSGLLSDYTQRVEVVESFVYMECVGVQLENHFSKKRSEALSAFEKKTDISTAINIATRKRIPGLVDELKAKLDRFGSDVTHTSVKEAKEAHLESKSVKTELHELALRRLLRARETSTERAIGVLKFWSKEEESSCISELNALGETLECIENSFLRALG